ncbi:hypothetical protein Q5P01_025196 [Channa striata]|uniref:Uncharacterized protein n=1 Tax=Channa striata TaxID=64152 RepID=A0AA88LH39_CHASR|nr:hypothetical protein Q5P01_025196 [Channa striata]
MARAALTKLFILVILAFIICLPEFFSLYKVSKVNFLCLPYQPCVEGDQAKKGVNLETAGAEIRRICDPAQTVEHEKLEQACAQANQSNTTGLASGFRGSSKDREDSWFTCQTDTDMMELHSNILTSVVKVYLEVSVEFHLDDTEALNVTFYSHNNFSSLHLDSLEEEEEERTTSDEEQNEAFYCCLPVLPTSELSNQSRCLLWLANQTVLTAREKLPGKWSRTGEWRCIRRVLWLCLLCVVVLIIVTTVIGQIYWKGHSSKNPKVLPFDFTRQQLNDGEKHIEVAPIAGPVRLSYEARHWSGLSPIQECEIQEDIETLLDGSVDNCYTANLHHRVHPSTSSLTEEQAR